MTLTISVYLMMALSIIFSVSTSYAIKIKLQSSSITTRLILALLSTIIWILLEIRLVVSFYS